MVMYKFCYLIVLLLFVFVFIVLLVYVGLFLSDKKFVLWVKDSFFINMFCLDLDFMVICDFIGRYIFE